MDKDIRAKITEEQETGELGLWWLSFVDSEKSAPEGEQVSGGGGFLGVCIVEAWGPVSAVGRAWALGINPGGEVGIMGPAPMTLWGEEVRDRLLTADEAREL